MSGLLRWGPVLSLALLLAPFAVAASLAFGGRETAEGAGADRREEALGDDAEGRELDSLARVVRERGPFRVDGQPSGVPYDPGRMDAALAGTLVARPALRLRGVIEGTTPVALLEGVPGLEGPILVGVGDTVRGLRIRRIGGRTVTVTGMDTTWVLSLQEAQ
jgi:hypothetical protein